jgi:hypothetical protein
MKKACLLLKIEDVYPPGWRSDEIHSPISSKCPSAGELERGRPPVHGHSTTICHAAEAGPCMFLGGTVPIAGMGESCNLRHLTSLQSRREQSPLNVGGVSMADWWLLLCWCWALREGGVGGGTSRLAGSDSVRLQVTARLNADSD